MREGIPKSDSVQGQTAKRRLLVFSPSRQNRAYQLQMDALSGRRCALDEYDIEVDEVLETETAELELREELGVTPGQFRVVLVGKDSHVKMSAESCISCEEVIMRVQNEPTSMETVLSS